MQGKGVLCHLTSLPEVSLDGALQFLDWLKANRFDAWQMLPLTPPDKHGSPYASPSAFAAWPKLCRKPRSSQYPTLRNGLTTGRCTPPSRTTMTDDPGLNGQHRFETGILWLLRTTRMQPKLHREQQQCFDAAWSVLAEEAGRNITLIGDVPIFIAHDSADVWAHRNCSNLTPPACLCTWPACLQITSAKMDRNGGRCSTIGTPTSVRVGDGGFPNETNVPTV